MPQLPAVVLGFDKESLPTGGGPASEASVRRLTFARWLYNHTNWRIAGGYPTIAASVKRPAGLEHAEPYVHALLDENRGWSSIFEDLWTHGWGIGIFAVVLSRKSLYYKDTATNAELADDVTRQPRIAARPVAPRPPAAGRRRGPRSTWPTSTTPARDEHSRRLYSLLTTGICMGAFSSGSCQCETRGSSILWCSSITRTRRARSSPRTSWPTTGRCSKRWRLGGSANRRSGQGSTHTARRSRATRTTRARWLRSSSHSTRRSTSARSDTVIGSSVSNCRQVPTDSSEPAH